MLSQINQIPKPSPKASPAPTKQHESPTKLHKLHNRHLGTVLSETTTTTARGQEALYAVQREKTPPREPESLPRRGPRAYSGLGELFFGLAAIALVCACGCGLEGMSVEAFAALRVCLPLGSRAVIVILVVVVVVVVVLVVVDVLDSGCEVEYGVEQGVVVIEDDGVDEHEWELKRGVVDPCQDVVGVGEKHRRSGLDSGYLWSGFFAGLVMG